MFRHLPLDVIINTLLSGLQPFEILNCGTVSKTDNRLIKEIIEKGNKRLEEKIASLISETELSRKVRNHPFLAGENTESHLKAKTAFFRELQKDQRILVWLSYHLMTIDDIERIFRFYDEKDKHSSAAIIEVRMHRIHQSTSKLLALLTSSAGWQILRSKLLTINDIFSLLSPSSDLGEELLRILITPVGQQKLREGLKIADCQACVLSQNREKLHQLISSFPLLQSTRTHSDFIYYTPTASI